MWVLVDQDLDLGVFKTKQVTRWPAVTLNGQKREQRAHWQSSDPFPERLISRWGTMNRTHPRRGRGYTSQLSDITNILEAKLVQNIHEKCLKLGNSLDSEPRGDISPWKFLLWTLYELCKDAVFWKRAPFSLLFGQKWMVFVCWWQGSLVFQLLYIWFGQKWKYSLSRLIIIICKVFHRRHYQFTESYWNHIFDWSWYYNTQYYHFSSLWLNVSIITVPKLEYFNDY